MTRLRTLPWLRRQRIALAIWLLGLGIALAAAVHGAPESLGVGFGFANPLPRTPPADLASTAP